MHTMLDNFHQGGKYTAHIVSHQVELRREGKFTDQKYLSVLSLNTDYLNIDSSSGYGKNYEKANLILVKCTVFGGYQPTEISKETSSRNLTQLVIWTDNKLNAHLKNVLGADM